MGAILDALAAGKTPKPGPQIDRQTSCPEGGPTTLKKMAERNYDYRPQWTATGRGGSAMIGHHHRRSIVAILIDRDRVEDPQGRDRPAGRRRGRPRRLTAQNKLVEGPKRLK